MIIISFFGLFVLWIGFQAFWNKQFGTDYFARGFRYRQIWYPAQQATRAGLLLSIWGTIFIIIGLYATINDYEFSLIGCFGFIGYIFIIASFAYMNRDYVKAEKERQSLHNIEHK